MTNIGILIDILSPGGVQRNALEQVFWLNSLGFQVKLLVLSKKNYNRRFTRMRGVPIEFISDRYPRIFRKGYRLPFFRFLTTLHLLSPILAPWVLNKNEFDLLISHGTTTSLTAWSLKVFQQIPYIMIIHDPLGFILQKIYLKKRYNFFLNILRPLLFFLEKQIVRAATLCITDSKVHKQYLNNNYSVTPHVLYLGTTPKKITSSKRSVNIVAFSRWDRDKKPEVILHLAASLDHVPFIIAGTWTSSIELNLFRRKIKELKLASRVKIIPDVTDKKLSRILERALIYLHPNFEAFGLSALEAAAHGCALIIPRGSGVTELFKQRVHGLFPQSGSYESLLPVLKKLLRNPDKTGEMGKKARQVSLSYTWQTHTHKLAKIINKLPLK